MPTFATPGPISATVDVPVGDVQIRAGDGEAAVIDVRPSDAASDDDVKVAQRTRVEYADEQLLVRSPKLRSWLPRNAGGSVDVTIELPAGSQINAAGQLTDFRCDGRLGECRIKTGIGEIQVDEAARARLKSGIGDITIDHATGHAELGTSSGEVRARTLDGSAAIKNANGDTWVGAVAGELRASAANGSIAVDVATAGVVAKSSNGDVRVGEAVRGSMVLETRLGDVEVGVREGTAAFLDVNAKTGRVHNSLAAAQAPDQSTESVEVRARTSVGNVVVRRP
jgi:DUF4097 and DUF4098 domain-containing protein YvlB